MPDTAMPRPSHRDAEAIGLKYAPAAGNWQIEVDGNIAFEFSPSDEAEARLAYNQIKREEPSAKLKRAKEAGDNGVKKSDLPSDHIKPSKAAEMLRNPPHGKPLTEPQRRMLEAAKHKNDKADTSTVQGGGPQGNAYARFNQEDSRSPAERADDAYQDTAVDQAYRQSGGQVWKITYPEGHTTYAMDDSEAIRAQEGGLQVEEVTDVFKARAAQYHKASVQTPQGTTVGVKPGQANPNLPAASTQPTTSESPAMAPSDPAQASQQGQVGTMEDTNPEGKAMPAEDQKIDVTQIVQALRGMGITARVGDVEYWPPEELAAVAYWLENGGPEPEVLINLHHVQPDHVVGKSGRARGRKASPASEYLATLKDMGKKVREKPGEARDFYEGADEAQAKVQEWIEAKEQDLATFATERWQEAFDEDVLEQAEEHGTIEKFREELHDLMTELSDVVQEADQAFEAVTNSTDEGGVDEDAWAEHIVTQDALERFLQEFPKKFVDLQEEFYQAIGEWQVEKEEGENANWEEQVEEAIEELDSIEDRGHATQRAQEINEEFRKNGNQYRLVFEGNEWRYNDVETLQEEGYDVKGRHSMRRKSALAGMAKSHRAARRKASPASFIDQLSGMIEDAGTPAAHQAVDAGFDEAEKFIDQHGKQVVDEKLKAWKNQFGKDAVDHASDAIGHFKDDVKDALNEIRTAMEVAVNSYKATSAAGTSGDMQAVEDATGDYEASASELQDLMEQFDQRVEAAAASCERAIMAGRGQLAYESISEKSGARRRKRDYVAEYRQIKKLRPAYGSSQADMEMIRKGAAPAGATFPAPAPVIYAVPKKICCGKGGCECGCNGGRCYTIKYAPGMEALDTDAQRVMDKIEGPRANGIQLDKGAMSATCILATSGQDREGDVIDIAGVDFAIHKINPVVMLDHGVYYPLPIGLTRNPGTGAYLVQKNEQAGEITETTYFSQRSEMAEQVYALIDEGIINANSIGFDPIETTPIGGRRQHGKEGPKIVHKANLIEVTWTPLPVNPEAVRAAMAKNIAGRPMARAIKSMLARRVPSATVKKHWERVGWDNGRDSHAHVGKAEGNDEDGAERWQFVDSDEANNRDEALSWAADYLGRIEPDAQLTGNVQGMQGYGWQVGYRVIPQQAGVPQDPPFAWQPDIWYPEDRQEYPNVSEPNNPFVLEIMAADYDSGRSVYNWSVSDSQGNLIREGVTWSHDLQGTVDVGQRFAAAQQRLAEENAGRYQDVEAKPGVKLALSQHVDEDQMVEVASNLFGGKVSGADTVEKMRDAVRAEAAKATAVPDNSKVDVATAGPYTNLYQDDVPVNATGMRVIIENEKLGGGAIPIPGFPKAGAAYFVGRENESGQMFVRIEGIEVKKQYQGDKDNYLMLRMVDDIVTNGILSGFSYIGCHAAGNPAIKDRASGYIAWPKFGFDETLGEMEADVAYFKSQNDPRADQVLALIRRIRSAYPDANSVLDVFDMGGAKWWEDNGGDLFSAKFDLSEGSRSREVLDATYARKVKK